jgi:hypothetical protein
VNDEENYPIVRSTIRVDSFEVLLLGEVNQTVEERSWPVCRSTARVDSFEFAGDSIPSPTQEIGLRISLPKDATPDETAAVVAQLRAATDSIRAATGRRFVIELAPPAS